MSVSYFEDFKSRQIDVLKSFIKEGYLTGVDADELEERSVPELLDYAMEATKNEMKTREPNKAELMRPHLIIYERQKREYLEWEAKEKAEAKK